jgi:Mce-associated membrane protein
VTRSPGARRAAVALLAALAVAAAAVLLVAAPKVSEAGTREDRREAVLTAARQQAVNFTTLDYRRLDRDLGRVEAGATGQFRNQFRSGAAELTELVTQNKAVAKGEVLEAGIVSEDADSARVLVVADSEVTNTGSGGEPQMRHYRIRMDLVRQDGRWLVSDLSFVG